MPLHLDEISPGIIAFLDGEILQSDPNITTPDHDGPVRSGPFLCSQVKDGASIWLHITRQPKDDLRLELKKDWKIDGSSKWKSDPQYINDTRKPFTGPNQSFVNAATKEIDFTKHKRPKICATGVNAVIAKIDEHDATLL